ATRDVRGSRAGHGGSAGGRPTHRRRAGRVRGAARGRSRRMSDASVVELGRARSFLFVPGDRPERFGKAAGAGADVVVLDLEDAVAGDNTQAAREHIATWLDSGGRGVVRVCASDTHGHRADVDALV